MATLNRIDIKFFSFNDTEEPTLLKEGECQQLVDCLLDKNGILRARPRIYKEIYQHQKSLGLNLPFGNNRLIFLSFFKNYILQGLMIGNIGHLYVAEWKDDLKWTHNDWKELTIYDENRTTEIYNYGLPISTCEYNDKLYITNLEKHLRRIISFNGIRAETKIFKIGNQEITFNFLLTAWNSLFLVRPVWYPNRIYWTYPNSEEIGEDNWADIGDEKPITYACLFQGQFLVFKEDKIYQIMGFERALMPDAIIPVANVGSPLGIVANYRNQFLTFLANDGDIYVLEQKQLTNISRKKISVYLQNQNIPKMEERIRGYVCLFDPPNQQIQQIKEAQLQITKGYNNVFKRNDFIRNERTRGYYNEEWTGGGTFASYTNAEAYSFIINENSLPRRPPFHPMRINKIIFKMKAKNPQNPVKVFLQIYEMKETEKMIGEAWVEVSSAREYDFDFGENWTGGKIVFYPDKKYRIVLTTKSEDIKEYIGNVIDLWVYVSQFVNLRQLQVFIDGRWINWKEETPEETFYYQARFQLVYITFSKVGKVSLTFQILNKCEGFSEWGRIIVKSDCEVELKITFKNSETGISLPERIIERLEKTWEKDTIITLSTPCFYDVLILEFTLYPWWQLPDGNYLNPSHLGEIRIEWKAPIKEMTTFPKVIGGKEAVYYAFVDKVYFDDTKRYYAPTLRTILRIDELKNFSVFNVFEKDINWNDTFIDNKKARIELVDLVRKDDWIFLVQNIAYRTRAGGTIEEYTPYTHFFNENYKTLNPDNPYSQYTIPYKIYILSKCIPSAYWNVIRKILLKGFISLSQKTKIALIPYRTPRDLEIIYGIGRYFTWGDRYGGWMDRIANREKVFYLYHLEPYNINPQEKPYSYATLQQSYYKVYQLFANLQVKDFCFALKSEDPYFAFFPIITFEYTTYPTILTGIEDIDAQKTEKGL
jgi:hypothetical protein